LVVDRFHLHGIPKVFLATGGFEPIGVDDAFPSHIAVHGLGYDEAERVRTYGGHGHLPGAGEATPCLGHRMVLTVF